MNGKQWLRLVLLGLMLGLIAIGAPAHEDEPADSATKKPLDAEGRAVVASLEAFAAAYAATDMAAMQALTVPDGRFSYIEGTSVDWTWSSYAAHLAKEMPAFSETRYQITDIQPEVVGDMAFATFSWAMDVVIMSDQFPGGRHPVSMQGVGTAVLMKVDSAWKLRHLQTARAALAAAARMECTDCPPLARVPAGRFMMGSSGTETVDQGADAGRVSNERPVHEVVIGRKFQLVTREVTRGEFAQFVDATGRSLRGCANWEDGGWVMHADLSWQNPGFPQTDDDPVVCVSWQDAQDYIGWLNARTGQVFRLPSEAEWEYAARAGQTGQHNWVAEAEACQHANGADLSAAAAQQLPQGPGIIFACDDGYPYTSPAGRFAANDFGLHDMLGNAWEWVADCYSPSYDGAPADGSARTDGECEQHALRGGSWKYPARTVRFAIRGPGRSTARTNNAGFRLASD